MLSPHTDKCAETFQASPEWVGEGPGDKAIMDWKLFWPMFAIYQNCHRITCRGLCYWVHINVQNLVKLHYPDTVIANNKILQEPSYLIGSTVLLASYPGSSTAEKQGENLIMCMPHDMVLCVALILKLLPAWSVLTVISADTGRLFHCYPAKRYRMKLPP